MLRGNQDRSDNEGIEPNPIIPILELKHLMNTRFLIHLKTMIPAMDTVLHDSKVGISNISSIKNRT